MKRNLGDTSNIERVSIVSSADGSPVTGLTSVSVGLIISTIASNEAVPTVYAVAAGNVETIATLGTYAAPTASKCRFKEIDATNHPGDYEIQLADARYVVASSDALIITASGVAGMLKMDLRIQLNVDNVNANVVAVDGSIAAATRLKLLSEFGTYGDGLVWLRIPGGVSGDTDYENGTMLNPVDNMADAITIAGSIPGISGFRPLPGTTVLLTQDFANTLFQGLGWTLEAAGFDLSNCRIFEAFVDGGISTSDTQNAFFIDCIIWSHTIGSAVLRDCVIANDMTLGEAGSYTLINCSDAQAITQAAINYNSLGGATVQMDRWSGTIELKNMAAGDELNIYGDGAVIINASCTGGTINRAAGNFPIEDNAAGAVTVTNELARFSVDRLASAADITLIINYVRGRKAMSKSGLVWSLTVYDHTDDVTPILVKAIKDLNGNDIDDLVAGQLAMELKSSV